MPERRPLRLLAPALLAALLAVPLTIGTAAPAEAAPLVRATVTVSSRVAAPGATVVVRGTVSTGRTPLRRTAVAIQHRVVGTTTWRTLRRVTTSSTGGVAVRTASLVRSEQFRVRVMRTKHVTSTVAQVVVPTSVTVTGTSSRTPVAGDPVVLSGRASAQLVGRRVYLQWLHNGQWRSVASSLVESDAGFSVSALATVGGEQQYRAFFPTEPGRLQTVSDAKTFTVSAWYRLADMPLTGATSTVSIGRAVFGDTVEDQTVSAALAEGESADVSIALDSRCSAFRAMLGVSNGADQGFFGRWRAFADDDLALDVILDPTAVQQQTVDITGADALTLRTSALVGGATTGWGNAEVLCQGRP